MDKSEVGLSLTRLRRTTEALAVQARQDAIDIGFEIARYIVKRELRDDPRALVDFADEAMSALGAGRAVRLRVSPEDLERLENTDATSGHARLAEVEVCGDPLLSPGDVEVDTELGLVDGTLDRRFKNLRMRVERELGAPVRGELEGAGEVH